MLFVYLNALWFVVVLFLEFCFYLFAGMALFIVSFVVFKKY